MKGDRTAELENGQHLRGLLLPGSDERTARESGNTVRNRRGSGTHAGFIDSHTQAKRIRPSARVMATAYSSRYQGEETPAWLATAGNVLSMRGNCSPSIRKIIPLRVVCSIDHTALLFMRVAGSRGPDSCS